ncbi:unnamed protein product [Dovyalis caffra]|uniref:Uncharacterized protein n=1 Tax=Dovyalis caffra TaxID=77055 RepID=A0AAV1SHD9_9ROSI|nr:unnamed protein product [Dovyalis caffra]
MHVQNSRVTEAGAIYGHQFFQQQLFFTAELEDVDQEGRRTNSEESMRIKGPHMLKAENRQNLLLASNIKKRE